MEQFVMSSVAIRTIDQRPAPGSMIKPGELIDVLDMALTLSRLQKIARFASF